MTLTATEYKYIQLDERNVPIIAGTTRSWGISYVSSARSRISSIISSKMRLVRGHLICRFYSIPIPNRH